MINIFNNSKINATNSIRDAKLRKDVNMKNFLRGIRKKGQGNKFVTFFMSF